MNRRNPPIELDAATVRPVITEPCSADWRYADFDLEFRQHVMNNYVVDATGRVFKVVKSDRLITVVEMKQHLTGDGYYRLSFRFKILRSFLVHRLVRLSFEKATLPDAVKPMQVHHLDRNRQNNRLDNLQWLSALDHGKETALTPRTNKGHCKPIKMVETKIRDFIPYVGKTFANANAVATFFNSFEGHKKMNETSIHGSINTDTYYCLHRFEYVDELDSDEKFIHVPEDARTELRNRLGLEGEIDWSTFATSKGRVRTTRGKLTSGSKAGKYKVVVHNGNVHRVHRILMTIKNNGSIGESEVNHKSSQLEQDGTKSNDIDNLETVTGSGNMRAYNKEKFEKMILPLKGPVVLQMMTTTTRNGMSVWISRVTQEKYEWTIGKCFPSHGEAARFLFDNVDEFKGKCTVQELRVRISQSVKIEHSLVGHMFRIEKFYN